MGAYGRKLVEEKYGWTGILDKYEALYGNLAKT